MSDTAKENTDKQLWQDADNGDSVFVAQGGGLGINCGGMVYVKPMREWHRIVSENEELRADIDQALRLAEKFAKMAKPGNRGHE